MVPLRVANMIGCVFFAGFGALAGNITTFLLYLLMLPINAWRLRQMLTLVKMARSATQGDTSMEWLKPFMTQRKYRKGDVVVRKDDVANEMRGIDPLRELRFNVIPTLDADPGQIRPHRRVNFRRDQVPEPDQFRDGRSLNQDVEDVPQAATVAMARRRSAAGSPSVPSNGG